MALGLLISVPALANDGVFGGKGSNLIPLTESAVRMAAEDIVAEFGTGWTVKATYTFENTGDAETKLQMGFPEFHCQPDQGDCTTNKGKFVGLKTTVRGKEVPNKTGKVDPSNKWAPEVGTVYLYDVTFAPKETVEIVHTYLFDGSMDTEGSEFEYLTRTGNLWSKPIGKATFTVRTPTRPWLLAYPPEYALLKFVETYDKKTKKAMTELVFQATNWKPVQNLSVYLGGRDVSLRRMKMTKCRDALRAIDNEAQWATAVGAMNKAELAQCRNAIYAAHGYTFKKKTYRTFFYTDTKDGRGHGGGVSESANADAPRRRWFTFRENAKYTPKLLTLSEQAWVGALKKAERKAKK